MTYAWPTASTIHPAQCEGVTVEGVRCRHKKWTMESDLPYYCQPHDPTPYKVRSRGSSMITVTDEEGKPVRIFRRHFRFSNLETLTISGVWAG